MKQVGFLFLILMSACAHKQNRLLSKNLYNQSLFEFKQKNHKKSLQLVNEALEEYKNPQALAHKAILLYELEKYNESLQIFKQLSKDPKLPPSLRPDIMNNYACNLLSVKKNKEAKEIWLDLTTDTNYLSPEVAWHNIGMLELLESKKNASKAIHLQEAKKAFIEAIKISKEYIDALFYLAITDIMLGNIDTATQTLIELIAIAPEHTSAKQILEQIDSQTTLSWN